MKNVHSRVMNAPIEKIRPWIEAAWTATEDDPFPHDVLPTWRKNPPGEDRLALIPGVTRIGHGPFGFRFASWDGKKWRVTVESDSFAGWHGFDLEPTPDGCRVTHTIELDLSGYARVVWPTAIAGIHDWAVEALFDRIEEGVRTGRISQTTKRPLPWPASMWFRINRRVIRMFDHGRREKEGNHRYVPRVEAEGSTAHPSPHRDDHRASGA